MSGSIKILASEFTQDQPLQLAPGIKAGFPSPATDYLRDSLDDGDLTVIDHSLEPNNGDIIVAYINNEFTIKTLDLSHRSQGYIELLPANPTYKPIRITDTDSFMVWGVVVYGERNKTDSNCFFSNFVDKQSGLWNVALNTCSCWPRVSPLSRLHQQRLLTLRLFSTCLRVRSIS